MNMKKNNTDKAFSKKLASDFSASLNLDKRLYKEDIELSIAYSKALKKIDCTRRFSLIKPRYSSKKNIIKL